MGGDKGWGEVVCYINEMKFGKKLICAEGIVDKANLLLTFTTYFRWVVMEKNPVVSKQRNDQWLMFNQLSAS